MQGDHAQAEHHVIINFGVAASRSGFDLESIGKNVKNFCIPDEGGNQPMNECIDGALDISHKLECDLDLASVSQRLEAKGYPCKVSQDAGDYICNYTYYRNLQMRQSFCTDKCVTNLKSLFCHVPSFTTVNEAQQKAFIVDLLKELAASL